MKRILLSGVVFLAFLCHEAMSQGTPCGSDSIITTLIITILPPEGDYTGPITVDVSGAHGYTDIAHPSETNQWKFTLHGQARLRECIFTIHHPEHPSYEAVQQGKGYMKYLFGKCCGVFVFKFASIWQLKVESDPENVRIESPALVDGPIFTNFLARVGPRGDLKLNAQDFSGYRLEIDLRSSDDSLVFDHRDIVDRICFGEPHVSPWRKLLITEQTKTHSMTFRWIKP